MHERMLDKNNLPSEYEINDYLGIQAVNLLHFFEKALEERYDLKKEIKFPFGNNYGWGYKYSHKTKHLCYLFFEKNAFTIMLQISGNDKNKLESILDKCLPKSQKLWEQRYSCGEGGWMHYRVHSIEELTDVIKFIEIKKKPII